MTTMTRSARDLACVRTLTAKQENAKKTMERVLRQVGHIGEWAGNVMTGKYTGALACAKLTIDHRVDLRADGKAWVSRAPVDVQDWR